MIALKITLTVLMSAIDALLVYLSLGLPRGLDVVAIVLLVLLLTFALCLLWGTEGVL